jgi:DNA-binding CsgD family transcriptional regulator
LCRQGLDADTFRRQLRSKLHALVAFDAYCVNTADPTTLEVTGSVGDGLEARDAARLFELEHARTDVNLLAELARGPVHVATIGERPERSERMRTLFLPRGWVDELRAALVDRGHCWGYLHLFRSTRFSSGEVARVASVVRAIAGALRSAAVSGLQNPVSVSPALLTLSDEGSLRPATRTAEELGAALPGDRRHGGPPHAIVSLAAAARAGAGSAESHVSTSRGAVRVVALAEQERAVIMIDTPRRQQLIEAAFALHRLSPRETEVCHAMLRGSSDKQIASALRVGLETVKAQARTAFAKLGVQGRGGLLASFALEK